MDELNLKQENKMIKVLLLHNDWCQLFFKDGNIEIKLGATTIDRFSSKLIISFLSLNDRNFFIYSGMKLFSIVNLMDSHAVIAGRYKDKLLELVFLDTNGNVVPMMKLTEKTMVEWINEIICFISRKNE